MEEVNEFLSLDAEAMADIVSMVKLSPEECESYYSYRDELFEWEFDEDADRI
jgi:hypothetical protein